LGYGSSLPADWPPNLATLINVRSNRSNRRRIATAIAAIMLEAFPPQDRGKAMAFWGWEL